MAVNFSAEAWHKLCDIAMHYELPRGQPHQVGLALRCFNADSWSEFYELDFYMGGRVRFGPSAFQDIIVVPGLRGVHFDPATALDVIHEHVQTTLKTESPGDGQNGR